jgi:predicted transposase YbfD/YdcC
MEDKNCSLIDHFDGIKDPRIERKKLHKIIDIIIIAICAVVSGADGFDAIEIFGKAHKEWFKKYLELPNGIPSHDTFERVLCRLDPLEFRMCFASWTKDLAGIFTDVIAIDGQTHRGTRSKGQLKSPIHMVSAWATGLRLVLAQVKVDEKSNEITAIPEVLKILDIHGCIITIDAMGCQQKIADQIIKQGGDYIFGLKGNQGSTLDAAQEHFSLTPEDLFKKFSDVDKGHGRIEIRTYLAADANSIIDLKEWPGLKSVIKVISTREINDVSTTEERYYLSSIESNLVKKIGLSIRAHWGVENSLHYTLDVTFGQDKSRIRTGNGAENMGVLRHIAINILKNAPNAKKSSPSNNLKRMRAAMDTDYLTEVMKSAGLDKS